MSHGGRVSSPAKRPEAWPARRKSRVTVCPDLISTGCRRVPISNTRSASSPLLSRHKYRSAGRPSLKRPLANSATTHVSNRAPRLGCRVSTFGMHCDDAIVNLYRLRRASAFDRMGWPYPACPDWCATAVAGTPCKCLQECPDITIILRFSATRALATRPLLATGKQPQQPFGEARYGLWVGRGGQLEVARSGRGMSLYRP